MAVLRLEGVALTYAVAIRPRRRAVAVQVDGNGVVTVLVPPGHEHLAEEALRRHAAWVLRRVRWAAAQPAPPTLVLGSRILYRGQWLTVEADPNGGSGGSVTAAGGLLLVGGPEEDVAGRRQALLAWYRGQAAAQLPTVLAREARRLGARPHAWRLRDYRSRWGTCRADGLITLNWRLVGAPPTVMAYVAVHELLHLRYPNHQAGFQAALRRAWPTAAEDRGWLRTHGRLLYW
jgi:predicted metal-dependent hydrolase